MSGTLYGLGIGPGDPGLITLKAKQIVKLDQIGASVPAEPVIKLEAEGSDPIGDIIDKMKKQ